MVKMNSIPIGTLEYYKEQTAIPLSINNARQLAGLPLRDGRKIKDGRFLRTTQLHDLTPEDIRILTDRYHLKVIADMRSEDEIQRAPDPEISGAKWVHVPVIDMDEMKENIIAKFQGHVEDIPRVDPTDHEQIIDFLITMMRKDVQDNKRQGATAYADYLRGKTARKSLGIFFHEAAALTDGAILWHCMTGKDRTGIASGLLLEVLGADWDTIVTDYEISNLYFEESILMTEKKLRQKGVEEELIARLCGSMAGVHVSQFEEAWKYMSQEWGGAIPYLINACGVSEKELEILKERSVISENT